MALASALRLNGATAAHNAAPAEPYDVVITGGRVLDGMGNPWFSADVAIRDGRIAAVGALCGPSGDDCPAKRKIDAAGLYVAPGFIDLLGQSEFTVLIDNRAESKIRQGITSE